MEAEAPLIVPTELRGSLERTSTIIVFKHEPVVFSADPD